jgi:hypothetical protein
MAPFLVLVKENLMFVILALDWDDNSSFRAFHADVVVTLVATCIRISLVSEFIRYERTI